MSLFSRGFTAVAVAAALTGMMASSTSATQASAAQLSVYLPDVLLGAGSSGTIERVRLGTSEPVTATQLRMEFDWSGLAGVATVAVNGTEPACSASGTVLTCVRDQVPIESLLNPLPELVVRPVAGVVPGASGTWRVRVWADGLAEVSAQAKVEVAEGVDLAATDTAVGLTGSPGGLVIRPLRVDNRGGRAADGAVLVFYGDYAFVATRQFTNCTYVDNRPRTCSFDEQLAAGGGYETSEPSSFKLREDTFAPGNQTLEFEWMTKADFTLLKKRLADQGIPDPFGQPGTGGQLRLMARPQPVAGAAQTDTVPSNNWGRIGVQVLGDNDADFAALGASTAALTGQVVTINLGVKNFGPATRDISRAGGGATIDFKLPQATSLAEMPRDCRAMRSGGADGEYDPDRGNLAARFIRCQNPSSLLIAGTQVTFAVKLRIHHSIVNAVGSVSVLTGGCDGCREDKRPVNDKAAVILNPASPPTWPRS